MGLFGFGKKKKSIDVDKLTEETNKNFDKVVKNTDFNALLKEKAAEQKSEIPVLELTEENLLCFISEHSGHTVTMSTVLGSIYDFSDPMTSMFLPDELEEKFNVHIKEELDEDMTILQVMAAMRG